MERVILLNSDYSFLNTISWKKAMCLMAKGKVEVVKASERILESAEKTWKMIVPKVLRLVKIVRTIYRTRVPFSKKNVVYRDESICQYCRIKHRRLTIDHVVPKSQGGISSFENCVSACKPCNNKKGNRTPRQARMGLMRQPIQPTIMEFLRIKMRTLGVDKVLVELGVY